MTGSQSVIASSSLHQTSSPLMRLVYDCLGGDRRWTGVVQGLFGFVNRTFVIDSTGELDAGELRFREAITFDNGETQSRVWRLFEVTEGVAVEGDGVKLLQHGRAIEKGFQISYVVKFGGIPFHYDDVFYPKASGGVLNYGKVKKFGVTIMNIEAQS